MLEVAAAGLTASVPPEVPLLRGTLVAVLPDDVGTAWAGPCGSVTVTHISGALRLQRASDVTGAASAVLRSCVAIVTRLAGRAGRPVGVVEALQALAAAWVT